MTKQLTAKSVENLKPKNTRQEIPDGGCRGLYLIVQPTGRKAWAVRYRFEGKPRKLTLDSTLTLAEAREHATKALREVERGNDPATLKYDAAAKAEQEKANRSRDTVERWAEQFITQY